jgi:hypothetical protein
MIAIVDEAFSMTHLENSYTKRLARNWLKFIYPIEIINLLSQPKYEKTRVKKQTPMLSRRVLAIVRRGGSKSRHL